MGGFAITTCILYFLWVVSNAEFNSTPEFLNCIGQTQTLTDYQMAVDMAVDMAVRDLITSTPRSRFNYYNKYETGDTRVYGHGICNGLLSIEDCFECLRVVNAFRIHSCIFVISAQVTLVDCEMTFRNEEFYHGGPRR